MSYIVLARKYRPQTFADLVGQTPVSQTLLNALSSNRIAHAYVFSGPRGVGKTTTARVLAKCLNCQNGPTQNPCNTCDSCTSIAQGTSVEDVLEIDGASNRGIEQIRDLRENAKYAPAKSRYRIYIIDEAHQITKDAFGALLKTLEEPPAHVIFMMATTEVHKIPAPILSRCQRFSLRPISPDLVFNHLKHICTQEKVKVEDDALKNIVRFVEGSMRDALSLLDQAVVFSPDGIKVESLRDLLGLLPQETIENFARVIKKGEPETILKTITEHLQQGLDLTQLAKDLQAYYHTLILTKAGVQDPLLPSSEALTQEARAYDFSTLERNIRILARALEEMRRTESPRVTFEIQALKMGQKVLDARALIERLDKLEKAPPAPRTTITPSAYRSSPLPTATPSPKTPLVKPSFSAPTPSTPPSPSKPKGPAASAAPVESAVLVEEKPSPDTIQSGWAGLIEDIAQQKQLLASALDEATLAVSEQKITLTFNQSFSEQMVTRSLSLIQNTMTQRFGLALPIETKTAPTNQKPKKKSPAAFNAPAAPASYETQTPSPPSVEFEDVSANDMGGDVQKALQHFPGTLKRKVQDT